MNPGAVGLEAALRAQKQLVDHTIGISGWVRVDQDMIDLFAESTHDHQYIHVDPVKARRCSPYSGTIAHGFLTLSLASRLSREALEPVPGQVAGLNYGLDKVRFVSPVHSGDLVRGHFRLKSVRIHQRNGLLRTLGLEVEIKDRQKPALVADWLILGLFERAT